MGAQHTSVAAYEHEIEANRARLTAPHDGAVFYTNGARAIAVDYARAKENVGLETKTLEGVGVEATLDNEKPGAYGTPYGAKLDQQNLFRNSDPVTQQLNQNTAEEIQSKDPTAKVDTTEGARAVWDKASRVYAEQSSGKVEVFTNGEAIRKNSFFARVERDVLINNDRVTSINGVDRNVLKALLDKGGPEVNQEINSRIEKGNENRRNRFEQSSQIATAQPPAEQQHKNDRDSRMENLASNDPATYQAIIDTRKKMLKLGERRNASQDTREKLGNAITDGLLKYHESGKSVKQLLKQPSRINRESSGHER